MKKPKEKETPLWRVVRITGTPAHNYGQFSAPDAKAAIAKAIEMYSIPEGHQDRLAAYRVS